MSFMLIGIEKVVKIYFYPNLALISANSAGGVTTFKVDLHFSTNSTVLVPKVLIHKNYRNSSFFQVSIYLICSPITPKIFKPIKLRVNHNKCTLLNKHGKNP